jgi:hypothetical protein
VPEIVSKLGRIPNGGNVTAHTVGCSISSASPLTGLNLLGGDNITVTGVGLPHHLDLITTSNRRRLSTTMSTVTLTFNDPQQTACVPQTSSPTQIVCLTDAFDSSVSSSANLALSINVNSQTVTNTLNFDTRGSFFSTVSISPSSASPVLKTPLTIQLPSDFSYTLSRNDFTVNMTKADNATVVKRLNVVSVDDTAKTIQAMFGGAYSGDYLLHVRHA